MVRYGTYKIKNPDELREYSFIKQIKDSWKYSKGYQKAIVISIILAGLTGLLAIIPSLLYGKIVDDLTKNIYTSIFLYLGLIAGAYILYNLFDRIIDRVLYINNLRVRNQTRINIYNHLFKMEIDFFERNSSGQIMSQITEGSSDVTRFNKGFYRRLVVGIFSFIFALATIIFFEIYIALIGAATIILYLLWAKKTDYKKIKLEYNTSIVKDKEQGKLHDYLGHVMLVKILNIKDNLIREMKKAQELILKSDRIARNYMNFVVFIQKNILDLSYVIVLLILSIQVMNGSQSVGIAVTIYALYTRVISEFRKVREEYNDILNTRVGMFKLANLWENKPSIKEPINPKKIRNWDKIEFENVSFKYHGKEKNALHDISFQVKKGEKLAIVGLSGSGKSTISKLLFKMYLPIKGKIKIGNAEIKEITSNDLYNLMKIVPQENELINASIYENLRLGTSQKVNKQDIIKALNNSHSTEFIKKLPEKINSLVGPNGVRISGGEKQRLCIARALLSKPEILVLDEATSHLDVVTEKKVHDSLQKIDSKQTLIAITHRISSLYLFDRILVLDKGKIVGQGTHKELLTSNQQYKKLWEQSKKLK